MKKNKNLHGNTPDESKIVLLIIDMISDFEFVDGEKLYPFAEEIAPNIVKLKEKAHQAEIPVIYANDNFGKWRSDFKKQLKHSQAKSSRGSKIARMLAPKREDYFVLKVKNSAFFSTTLETLLKYLGAETLILTGVTADICIFFTAIDAYLRDYKIIIPSDCVAAISESSKKMVLNYMNKILEAEISLSSEIDLNKLKSSVE